MNLIVLLCFVFINNTDFVASRNCWVSSGLTDFLLIATRELYRVRFTEFSERCIERFAARQDHCPLNEILQLTNIAGPVPRYESLHDYRRNGFNLLLHLLGKLLHKITHQLWNVFLTFAQRWYPDRKDMQAVVRITAEFAVGNHLFEIAIRGRHQAHIHSSRVRTPQPLKLALL
jgi:hypothetical protein